MDYKALQISKDKALEIALKNYNISGEINHLPGEVDFNFKLTTSKNKSYVLKISRPGVEKEYFDFQEKILTHLKQHNVPKIIKNIRGENSFIIRDNVGNDRIVRMLSWMDGRLWSEVNPITKPLLQDLGKSAGILTQKLQNFTHSYGKRYLEWDIATIEWTFNYIHLFKGERKEIVCFFHNIIRKNQSKRKILRKSVVHSDINDNNIVVNKDYENPKLISIIDFGDAIYTETVNDLAILLSYAIIGKKDPIATASEVIKAYHGEFPLEDIELELLYSLVASRLIISVTKAAINKEKEPENKYLLISEKPAWESLERWFKINEDFAYFTFRNACGFVAHPKTEKFENWVKQNRFSLKSLFPTLDKKETVHVDMSIGSTWLGNKSEYENEAFTTYKLNQLQKENPNKIIAGGYQEVRPFYSTDAYKKEGNNGPMYRTVHLGVDYWIDTEVPIHSLFDAKVYSIFDNDNPKDYGPTLILEHKTEDNITFYTLYGHLTKSTLKLVKKGQSIKKGELIGYVGKYEENGNWIPHLHFQIMLDLLGYSKDFPGVAFPSEKSVWTSVCPNPNKLFRQDEKENLFKEDLVYFRKKHLGKGMSLSYNTPLHIVRGDGPYLIDETGRKYLDTVNNVAHVGHEHPRVVKAGQKQMSLLNTNTRYLHPNINEFAKELLGTFPKELSVVHFVNSGSEANELALRMAKTTTNQKEIIAVEVGYHGNTNGCIDISSYKFDGKGGNGAPETTHIVPLPDSYRGRYQGENTGVQYASHVQEQIEKLNERGKGPAAFICESIISCGGQIELPKNYLKEAYKYTRKAGGLCISDEVQVGVGRVGSHFWGFQLYDVIPDIVTIGKPIGNGHPLAAVVCTEEVANAFANGMEYFNTFGGNPVSCAIGTEVLRVVKEEKLQENALEIGVFLKNELVKLQKQFSIIGDVRGQGLFLGFELTDKNKKPLADKTSYLANRMKDFGILMSTDGPDHNVLKIKPPMVFNINNAKELIMRLQTVFEEDFMIQKI